MIKKLIEFVRTAKIEDDASRTITFSNVIFISLPVVYFIFILIDIDTYFRPFQTLSWDQSIVPLFILVSLACIYLNYIGLNKYARLFFLLTWPLAMHIIPIVDQSTPADYYLAFPIGIIFHSTLIQGMISRKKNPLFFWVLLALNFIQLVFFKDFLVLNDKNAEALESLHNSRYYLLDGILYWLLFNLIFFYILEVVDYNVIKLRKDKELIEHKNEKIIKTLDQLHKTQNQLVQSEKLASLGVLAGGFAHELNNPINIVAGNMDLVTRMLQKDDQVDKDELKQLCSEAHIGLNRIKEVVNNVRLIATDSEQPVKISLEELLENVVYVAQQKGNTPATVEFSPNDDTEILCYASKLHKVVSSIVDNALVELEKMTEPGILRLSTKLENNSVSITISNNGPKIPKSDLSRIFDPFFTTRDPGQGLGLGLFVSYQIIKEMGGNISVIQENDFVCFKVEIPTLHIKTDRSQNLNKI